MYQGYYLNLNRSSDRLYKLVGHLQELGLADRYQRFPAIDGVTLDRESPITPVEVGIFASHMAVLELAAQQSTLMHILEDDAVLSSALSSVVNVLDVRRVFTNFDITLTEMMLTPNLEALKTLKERFDAAIADRDTSRFVSKLQLLDLVNLNFSGATSYFVTPRNARRLLPSLQKEWAAGPTMPIDLFFREKAHRGEIRMACIFPFLSSFDLSEPVGSTAGRSQRGGDSDQIMNLLRYAFFIDHDLQSSAETVLADVISRADSNGRDTQREFLSQILGLIVSNRFQKF